MLTMYLKRTTVRIVRASSQTFRPNPMPARMELLFATRAQKQRSKKIPKTKKVSPCQKKNIHLQCFNECGRTLMAMTQGFVNESFEIYRLEIYYSSKLQTTMKKTLMILTFALCATFVFAQTATPRMKEYKAPAKVAQVQNDYSSSLFTKDATPFVTVDFSVANSGYSTGVISGGIEGHAENYDFATWHRWANAETSTLTSAANIYPALVQSYFGGNDVFLEYMLYYLDTATSSAENGWMMMSLYDQRTPYSGNFNAYIRIDSIDASTASVVDVKFFQYYRKYYDHCYLDYSIDNGSTWVETEINTTGVDVDVNGSLWGMYSYNLPVAAAGNTISIRLRYKSLDRNSNTYGYYWIVDDISVLAGEPNRLKKYDQEYVEGNYGMIPQNMTINPAWYAQVNNTGAIAQANTSANLYHLDADLSNQTLVQSYNNGTLPVSTISGVYVDRAGWLLPDSMSYRGWYGYINHTAHGTGSALPTATAGDNYMYVQLSNDNVSLTFDTMYYQVTTANENNEYRWAHDNGILTYSPYNYYLFGYVYSGNNWYVTDDADAVHFYQAGYMVTSRYTTDQVVPEDWVIHGVELVASPADGFHSTGAKISATLLTDEYDGGSVSFNTVTTGANVKTITDSDVNDSTVIGRLSNGYLENGNYNTVYIPFPEQPALTANTSFRVGYTLEEEGYFALAHEAMGSYRMASPTRDGYDTIIYFRNNDATAKWANYYTPNQYQNYVLDPSYGGEGSGSTFSSWHVDYNPMIRLVVGPAREVSRNNIEVSCTNEEFGSAYYGGEPACGTTITPAQGSSATIIAESATGCVVEQILVDGTAVEPYNEDTEEGDPNFILSYDADLDVYVAQYTFENINADHTISFVFAQGGQESIDPVAANVRMNLQPNPATSQVNLNIEGVEGAVNCMLIDMSGRVVYNQNFNAATAQTINVSSLAKGAYFVRITNDKFSKVEKLIVR